MSGRTSGNRIVDLGRRRQRLLADYEAAHRELLEAVLEEASKPGANVRELAREARIAHGTVYNELARRQDRRDQLSSNGDVPAPAPHDDGPDAALEPMPELTDHMREALNAIAAGRIRLDKIGRVSAKSGDVWPRAGTIEALERRGLITAYLDEDVELTRIGRELVERGGAA